MVENPKNSNSTSIGRITILFYEEEEKTKSHPNREPYNIRYKDFCVFGRSSSIAFRGTPLTRSQIARTFSSLLGLLQRVTNITTKYKKLLKTPLYFLAQMAIKASAEALCRSLK